MTLLKLMPHERARPYTKAVRLLPAEKFIGRVHTKMGPGRAVKSKFRLYVVCEMRAATAGRTTICFCRSVQLLAGQTAVGRKRYRFQTHNRCIIL